MDITKWKSVLVPIEVYEEIKKISEIRGPDNIWSASRHVERLSQNNRLTIFFNYGMR